jgi:RimJ/RimL family protein N-acetyltransferase
MRDMIDTPRLQLRPFQAADAPRVAALVGDWDVARMLARVPHPYGADDAFAWFETLPAARACGRSFTFAIASAADGVIGAIGLDLMEDDDLYTLGYWLGQPYWGRGFASEAGAAILAYATEDLGATDYHSQHFVENAASGRVLEKLSFVYTGEVRPAQCLARGESVPAMEMKRTSKRGGRDE